MREFVRMTLCVIFLPLVMLMSAMQSNAQDRTQGRSMVISRRGMVAAENPLAAQAGATMLAHGGNAVDAAVATNAVMGVVEPMMNGIGGDLFAIVYDAKTRETLWAERKRLGARGPHHRISQKSKGIAEMPQERNPVGHGSGRGGRLVKTARAIRHKKFSEVLGPAIYYAREGFPVPEWDAAYWADAVGLSEARQERRGQPICPMAARRE